MKKVILYLLLSLVSFSITYAQSMLCTYKGGYFIRNGNTWYEYRPQDKDAVWSTYTQYSSDDNYFYIRNNSCCLSIPKSNANNIWIKKGNSDWSFQYTTINTYNYCPVQSNKIFAYQNGFFVKNGINWQEYDPKQKTSGALDNFYQYGVDDNFYYIKNTRISLAIPRKVSNNFYWLKNGNWITLYHPSALYEAQSQNAKSGNKNMASNGSSANKSSSNNYNSSNQSNYKSSTSQKWREELKYGMFAINIGDPNGAWSRTIYRACVACRGSVRCGNCHGMKMCTLCNGRGGIVTAGYGNYIPCMGCGQTGRCGVCHGTGKCACANYEYPGYMPGATMVVGANGQVIYDDYDSGSSSSRSSSNTRSSGTCSKCHGLKYESTAYTHVAASTSGWAQPYHNKAGSKCPYCNYVSDHYHYPCTECRGYGHK